MAVWASFFWIRFALGQFCSLRKRGLATLLRTRSWQSVRPIQKMTGNHERQWSRSSRRNDSRVMAGKNVCHAGCVAALWYFLEHLVKTDSDSIMTVTAAVLHATLRLWRLIIVFQGPTCDEPMVGFSKKAWIDFVNFHFWLHCELSRGFVNFVSLQPCVYRWKCNAQVHEMSKTTV